MVVSQHTRDRDVVSRYTRSTIDGVSQTGDVFPRQAALFEGVAEHDLAELAAAARRRVYARRALLAEEDRTGCSLYVVARGEVRLYRLAPDGRMLTLLRAQAGESFRFLARGPDGRPRTLAQATTVDTVVYTLPYARVKDLYLRYPHVAIRAIELAESLLGGTLDRLEDLALRDVRVCVAHALARLAARCARGHVAATHEEIGWLAGASRAQVSAWVGRLQEDGLVVSGGRYRGLTVPDPDALAAL